MYSGFPVSISTSTTPNAQMSARRSTGLPLACSGDMYAAVPRMTPCIVATALSVGELRRSVSVGSSVRAFARPKSSTFTVPSAVPLMLAGFRSR